MGLSPWGSVDGAWLEKVMVCGCGLEGFQSHGILSLLLLLGHFADPLFFFLTIISPMPQSQWISTRTAKTVSLLPS